MRPIDADALKDELMYLPGGYAQSFAGKACLMAIDDAPTLDYAPVRHGYWKHEEPVKDDGQKPFVCSTCGLRHPRYGDVDKAYFSYCPWCGTQMDAEMDGGEKDV